MIKYIKTTALFCLVVLCAFVGHTQNYGANNPRLESLLNNTDSLAVQNEIKTLLKNNIEEDYNMVIQYYNRTQQTFNAEELVEKTIEKFPKGRYAFIRKGNALITEKDPSAKEMLLLALIEDFPNKSDDMSMYYYDVMSAYSQIGNLKKTSEWFNKFSTDDVYRYYSVNAMADAMKLNSEDADGFLNEEIGKGLNIIRNADQVKSIVVDLQLRRAWDKREAGEHKEALDIIQKAYDLSERKNYNLLNTYAIIQADNGHYEEALPILISAVKRGQANDLITEYLKVSYNKVHKDGYEKFMEDIEVTLNDSIKTHLDKILLNVKAPAYTVKDSKGHTVKSEDLLGKVLVIDFWATWCGPCKKSFPSMNKALKKYQDDPNVMFLFVHTFERNEAPLNDAQEYLSKNEYDFPLYMDYKNEKTKLNPMAAAFQVNAIPTKIIIDPLGNIRFRIMGFSGGENAAVAEISAMISIAKEAY